MLLYQTNTLKNRKGTRKNPQVKATSNLNKVQYDSITEEAKRLARAKFRKIYYFHRLERKQNKILIKVRLLVRFENQKKIASAVKSVFVPAEGLKKKNPSGRLYKSPTQTEPYFNKDEIFIIQKIIKHSKVLCISDGCCTEFSIYLFILYLF